MPVRFTNYLTSKRVFFLKENPTPTKLFLKDFFEGCSNFKMYSFFFWKKKSDPKTCFLFSEGLPRRFLRIFCPTQCFFPKRLTELISCFPKDQASKKIFFFVLEDHPTLKSDFFKNYQISIPKFLKSFLSVCPIPKGDIFKTWAFQRTLRQKDIDF